MPAEETQREMEEVRKSWDRNPLIFACGVIGIGIIIGLIAWLTRKHRRPRQAHLPQTSGGASRRRHWPMPRRGGTKTENEKESRGGPGGGILGTYESFRLRSSSVESEHEHERFEKDLESGLGEGREWERETCAICLEEIQDSEIVRKLRCEHIFHRDCAARWYCCDLQTCPVCRQGERRHEKGEGGSGEGEGRGEMGVDEGTQT